jgi:hypothetical protein
MLTIEAITAALPPGLDAPRVGLSADVATIIYPSTDVYAARVSADVDALSALPGLALAESWTSAVVPLVVHLRYVAAPVVEVPRPIAPAPVPASAHRRR